MRRSQMDWIARNAVLYLKKMRIAAYQVRFFSNKVEGFTTSRSLRVFYNYPHTPSPVKHMNKLEDLKVM